MKGEIKKKYQECINHIDFPAMLYVYETNKIIAMNSYAIKIIGKYYEDIRDVFDGKKHRLSKDLLEGESKLIKNIYINSSDKEELLVDMDINVILVDNVHFVLVLFEKSNKNKFLGSMKVQVPRISWKYENYATIYMNTVLAEDIEENCSNGYVLDKEMAARFEKIKEDIIATGNCKFNSIQMINKGTKNSRFIKINMMPIIDSRGKNIGVLSIHNLILKKEEQQNLYDNVTLNDDIAYDMYKYILDNINSDVLICLDNNKIGYINKSLENNYEDCLLGMEIFDFLIRYRIADINAYNKNGVSLPDAIKEGFAKGKVSEMLGYDAFNDRQLSIKIQKIKWKQDKDALLFTFNEFYTEGELKNSYNH